MSDYHCSSCELDLHPSRKEFDRAYETGLCPRCSKPLGGPFRNPVYANPAKVRPAPRAAPSPPPESPQPAADEYSGYTTGPRPSAVADFVQDNFWWIAAGIVFVANIAIFSMPSGTAKPFLIGWFLVFAALGAFYRHDKGLVGILGGAVLGALVGLLLLYPGACVSNMGGGYSDDYAPDTCWDIRGSYDC